MQQTVISLKQGTKFTNDGKIYIKLPPFCECYEYECNAVDIRTGTMIYFSPAELVDVIDSDVFDELLFKCNEIEEEL